MDPSVHPGGHVIRWMWEEHNLRVEQEAKSTTMGQQPPSPPADCPSSPPQTPPHQSSDDDASHNVLPDRSQSATPTAPLASDPRAHVKDLPRSLNTPQCPPSDEPSHTSSTEESQEKSQSSDDGGGGIRGEGRACIFYDNESEPMPSYFHPWRAPVLPDPFVGHGPTTATGSHRLTPAASCGLPAASPIPAACHPLPSSSLDTTTTTTTTTSTATPIISTTSSTTILSHHNTAWPLSADTAREKDKAELSVYLDMIKAFCHQARQGPKELQNAIKEGCLPISVKGMMRWGYNNMAVYTSTVPLWCTLVQHSDKEIVQLMIQSGFILALVNIMDRWWRRDISCFIQCLSALRRLIDHVGEDEKIGVMHMVLHLLLRIVQTCPPEEALTTLRAWSMIEKAAPLLKGMDGPLVEVKRKIIKIARDSLQARGQPAAKQQAIQYSRRVDAALEALTKE